MLRVWSMAGEEVASYTEDEVQRLGGTVRDLKKSIALRLRPAQSRFRLRLIPHGGGMELANDMCVKLPQSLQVVVSGFCEADAGDVEALIGASKVGHVDVVEALLERPQDPNAANDEGFTPLLLAVKARQVDCMRLLLEAHADPDQPGPYGMSPLVVAVDSRELLVQAGLVLASACPEGLVD
mmetsp:Transcript_44054/g.79064  ORF Transcript_44054/g.79064 Transcript_44054/m.79064 type:complete len:182 (-) Transcript_44054:107-652(-)